MHAYIAPDGWETPFHLVGRTIRSFLLETTCRRGWRHDSREANKTDVNVTRSILKPQTRFIDRWVYIPRSRLNSQNGGIRKRSFATACKTDVENGDFGTVRVA